MEQPQIIIREDGSIELEGKESEEEFELEHIFKKYRFDSFSTYTGLISIYSSTFGSVNIESEIIKNGICLNFARQLISAKHPETKKE
ncbi:hypothetical protein [Mannheimia haemolytica]|uniref:hypothetical protein n=1 Tax=Mannheimia haemolytica TaxID=75985 RepID=UPI0031F55C49